MSSQLATIPQKQSIREYMRSDEIKIRFSEVLGSCQSSAYISSVLIAVANSNQLQQCEAKSIVSSALRAASLHLSCDPSTGQAHLVPYNKKATLVVGYKGLYHMALRTGKYRYINIIEVHPGETVTENRLTGMHTITGTYTDRDNIIGIMVYLEMVNGFKKTVYMTVEEIADHAEKYSKSYAYDSSVWKTNRRAMEKKTVLRLALSRWGYMDPVDMMTMNAVDEESNGDDLPELGDKKPEEPVNIDETLRELGYAEPDEDASIDGEFEDVQTPVQKPVNTGRKEPEEKKPERPYEPALLKKGITKRIEDKGDVLASDKQSTLLIMALNKCFAGETEPDKMRHAVTKYLTGKDSTKDMTGAEIIALIDWLKPEKDSGGEYINNPLSVKEAYGIVRQSLVDAGQMDLLSTAEKLGGQPA